MKNTLWILLLVIAATINFSWTPAISAPMPGLPAQDSITVDSANVLISNLESSATATATNLKKNMFISRDLILEMAKTIAQYDGVVVKWGMKSDGTLVGLAFEQKNGSTGVVYLLRSTPCICKPCCTKQ